MSENLTEEEIMENNQEENPETAGEMAPTEEPEEYDVEEEYVEEEGESIGLLTHLRLISDELLAISEEIEDPAEKEQAAIEVSQDLEECAREIEEMLTTLNDDSSENVQDLCIDIDRKFAEASGLFIEAISAMFSFMENENPELIKKANELLDKGSQYLEQADALAQELAVITREDPGSSIQA